MIDRILKIRFSDILKDIFPKYLDLVLQRDNPHKYLLYKPNVSQFTVFLASGQKELPPNGALMLYISGDGCFSTKPSPEDLSYDLGGVLLSTKKDYEQLHHSIINR